MLRPALVCVLAVLAVLAVHASRLAALETPLTITGPNGRVVMIDPALGSITCYEVTQSSSNRVGLGKASGNFVADAEMRLKYCPTEREGVPIQALRTGSLNNKPGYGNILGPKSPLLADKPTTKELAAGKAALTERVWQAETAFWKTNPTYDGTVRVALAGQYLAIALPSLHTLMIYQLESDVATLIAWHNWGPELFVQTGYNTPNPIEELNRLPPAQKKQALAALGVEDDSKPDGAAPAPPAPGAGAAEPPTPKSDVWIGAVSNDSFVLVDLPNQRAMLYQIRGKDLCLSSVRNLAFDLILPGLYEGAVKSDPAGERMLEAFVKSRKTQLEQFGLDADLDNVTLLVGQRQGKAAKASEFEAVMNGSVAFLNFSKSRVFLSLDTQGGNRLVLTAARDYTLDTGISLLDQEIVDRTAARQKAKEAAQLARSAPKAALLTLRLALALDPRLHKEAEKAIHNAFKGEQQSEAQALLDEAVKKAEALVKETEARRLAAAERKKKREQAAKDDAGK